MRCNVHRYAHTYLGHKGARHLLCSCHLQSNALGSLLLVVALTVLSPPPFRLVPPRRAVSFLSSAALSFAAKLYARPTCGGPACSLLDDVDSVSAICAGFPCCFSFLLIQVLRRVARCLVFFRVDEDGFRLERLRGSSGRGAVAGVWEAGGARGDRGRVKRYLMGGKSKRSLH